MAVDPFKMNRRLGRFALSRTDIEDMHGLVMAIQAKVLLHEITYDMTTDGLSYLGRCDDFDIVEPGNIVPTYDILAEVRRAFPRTVRLIGFQKRESQWARKPDIIWHEVEEHEEAA